MDFKLVGLNLPRAQQMIQVNMLNRTSMESQIKQAHDFIKHVQNRRTKTVAREQATILSNNEHTLNAENVDYTNIINEIGGQVSENSIQKIITPQTSNMKQCVICYCQIQNQQSTLKSCDCDDCHELICEQQCYLTYFYSSLYNIESLDKLRLCPHPIAKVLLMLLVEYNDDQVARYKNATRNTFTLSQLGNCLQCHQSSSSIRLCCSHEICQSCLIIPLKEYFVHPQQIFSFQCSCGQYTQFQSTRIKNCDTILSDKTILKMKLVMMQFAQIKHCSECRAFPIESYECKGCRTTLCLECGQPLHIGVCKKHPVLSEKHVNHMFNSLISYFQFA